MEWIKNKHIQNISTILENIGEVVEGNLICDVYPTNWTIHENQSKIKNLEYLCKDKKKIIEIGVNACHSLVIMLSTNPSADYLLFDLNKHTYTEPIIQYIRQAFPNTKIDIVYGNSVETIGQYILENPDTLGTYDLCHLDGGHSEDIFSVDYRNMKELVHRNGQVIFDDADGENIRDFIQWKLAEGEIVEYKDSNLIITNKHFIYQYTNEQL